jgi:hypothetical protein
MHVAFSQPSRSPITIDAIEGAHCTLLIADETMAGREFPVGGHAEIAGAGAARIWPMGAAVNLTHRVCHVGERIAFARDQPLLECAAAVDHTVQHTNKIVRLHFTATTRRTQHGRESDAVKSSGDEIIERPSQLEIIGCDSDAR